MANEAPFAVPLAFTILSVLVVALRVYIRVHSKPGWDDWVMVIAVIFNIAARSLTSIATYQGTKIPFTAADAAVALKYDYISTPFQVAVSVFARLSITLLLIRLFGVNVWLKKIYVVQFIVMSVLSIVLLVLTFGQVDPSAALWDSSLSYTRRWSSDIQVDWAIATNTVYTLSDLTFVVFPTMIIWKLNMSIRLRIGLISLLAISLLAMAESILRTVYLYLTSAGHSLSSVYNNTAILTLNLLEGDFVIIIGCAPVLRGCGTLVWPSLNSSMSHLFTRTRGTAKSRNTNTDHSGPYYDLEMSTHKLGTMTSDQRVEASAVAVPLPNEDTDRSVPGDSISRTDGYAVTYTTKRLRD